MKATLPMSKHLNCLPAKVSNGNNCNSNRHLLDAHFSPKAPR